MADIVVPVELPPGFSHGKESQGGIKREHALPDGEVKDTYAQARQQAEVRRAEFAAAEAMQRQSLPPAPNVPGQELPPPDRCRAADVELADGRLVEMEIPTISTQILSEKILQGRKFGDENMMGLAMMTCRAVLHVKSIDGSPVMRPTNEIEYNALCQRLGDGGVDAMFQAYLECFPPVSRSEIKIVKKY